MFNSRKILVVILFVICVSILGCVIYYFYAQRSIKNNKGAASTSSDVTKETSQNVNATIDVNPDFSHFDTSNWQMYRNEEYDFEVSYPNNWEKGESQLSQNDLPNVQREKNWYIVLQENGIKFDSCASILISVHDTPDDVYNLDDLVRFLRPTHPDMPDYKFRNSTFIEVNNQRVAVSDVFPNFINTLILNKDLYIRIEMGNDIGSSEITSECRNAYYNVLSTFRVIE